MIQVYIAGRVRFQGKVARDEDALAAAQRYKKRHKNQKVSVLVPFAKSCRKMH
jgi:hypothetical protein